MRVANDNDIGVPKRKSNRLQHYDYSQNGVYFITLCTKGMKNVLWCDVGASIARPTAAGVLSKSGATVETAIADIPSHYPCVSVDKYVVMPNHVHMIMVIDSDVEGGRTLCAPTVSRIVKQMKEAVTKRIGAAIWQKSFHDRVIRNHKEYVQIWEYIDTNMVKWDEDCYYTEVERS